MTASVAAHWRSQSLSVLSSNAPFYISLQDKHTAHSPLNRMFSLSAVFCVFWGRSIQFAVVGKHELCAVCGDGFSVALYHQALYNKTLCGALR